MNSVEELTLRIARLEREVLSREPQLIHSTIQDGATNIRDSAGNLTGAVGRQYDGTFTASSLAGPLPPQPDKSSITVTPIGGGLRVRYEGGLLPVIAPDPDLAATPTVAPMDFQRFEVHASDDPLFTGLLWLTLRRTIDSSRGGEVEFRIPQTTPYYVRILTRTQSGGISAASEVLGPYTAGKISGDEVDVDFSVFGGTTVFYGPSTPTAEHYGDLWLKEVAAGPPPKYETWRWYPDNTWKLLADQGASSALAAAIAAQSAADSKAQVFYQDTAPTTLAAWDKAIWFETDNGNKAWSWTGSAWTPRLLGSGSIQPASLVASDLIATGTVTATLLESILVLATEIVAGPPTGLHLRFGTGGLTTWAPHPEGTGVVATGGLATTEQGLTFIDAASGKATVAIDRTGDGAVQRFAVAGEDINGDGLIEGGLNIYGREFYDWYDDSAKGSAGSAFYADAASGVFASGISTPYGLGELSFTANPGRHYLILFDGLHYSMPTAAGKALIHLRFTSDGSAPTISNGAVLSAKFINILTAGEAYSAPALIGYGSFDPVNPVTIRVLIVVERFSGTSTITTHTYSTGNNYRSPFRFFANEMGRDIPDTYIANDGGGTRVGGTPTGAPTVKKPYVSTWTTSFVGSYYGSGVRRTDTTDMVEGFTSYYTAGGNQKALTGFVGNAVLGETSKTITAALAGATIQKVEFYLYCNHSNANWGGTADIGYHGNATLPATAPAATYGGFGAASYNKGSGRWITLPSSTHASWASGTYRGITVGPSGDYMRFTGAGPQRPALRITYTR